MLTLSSLVLFAACKQKDAVSNCYTCHKVTDSIYRAPWHGSIANYWYADTLLCGDTAAISHVANALPYNDSVQKTFTDTSGTHTYWAVYRQRFECVN